MVEPVYLFSLMDQQRSWLSARQAIVAQNVSNADTPGYRAQDIAPFVRALEDGALRMAGDSPLHMRPSQTEAMASATRAAQGWETSHSGNSVSPEQEMIRAGEIRGAYSLNTNLLHAFHGMWMTTLRL